ncbi:hypothetical protein ACQR1I_09115 [Bradyrhizobium sp. HKCCYLS2038]|uniref:hypothetical protein n=1 Tax=unclassified Bradyrhizobium TaxID=2631580 RepID=UPI003EB6D0F7
MRSLVFVILLIFLLACPSGADALDCAKPRWWNFSRKDGDAQKRRQDAEAREALEYLGPLVFRGRLASARNLSDAKDNHPVLLIVLKDVEVLRSRMPRSAGDRKAFILYHEWCDVRCQPGPPQWPVGMITYNAHPFGGGPVRDTSRIGQTGGKILYQGRVDAEIGVCDRMQLTPLQQQLLNAPAEEIARLIREYPYHAFSDVEPDSSD